MGHGKKRKHVDDNQKDSADDKKFKASIRLLDVFNDKETPHCEHGPTLAFERLNKNKSVRFYACAAYRNRKACPFYQLIDEKQKKSKQQSIADEDRHKATDNAKSSTKQLMKILKAKPEHRNFCKTCSKLFVTDAGLSTVNNGTHQGHEIRQKLSTESILRPSQLLAKLDNNRGEAQYHFDDETTRFLVDSLNDQHVTHVINIGTTSVHEYIQYQQTDSHTKLTSILLDIDERLRQFFADSRFVRFNMFNCHFFDSKGREALIKFIRKASRHDRIAIVVDPPFGGLINALSRTINKLEQLIAQILNVSIDDVRRDVKLMLIMPYFNERLIAQHFAEHNVFMSDYRVTYANHRKLKNSTLTMVRLFTNIAGNRLRLKPKELYKFCNKCNRYVHIDNQHCDQCSNCTSGGKQLKHCTACGTCRSLKHQHTDDHNNNKYSNNGDK